MIQARRAALLGLTVPLSPIMAAVLGLWPEPEDPPFELPPLPSGGDNSRADHFERDRQQQEIEDRLEAQNGMILSLVMAAVSEGMI